MELLQIVADPTRQRILQLVWDSEMTAGQIASQFDVTFGAISQHLALLRKAELVDLKKEGKVHHYRARKQSLGPIADYLEALWRGHLLRLKALAEFEEEQSCQSRRNPRPRGRLSSR